MHASELVETAALLATHANKIIHTSARIHQDALEKYWLASRTRHDRWSRSFKTYTELIRNGTGDQERTWWTMRPVLEEILLSEVLTRVWTGIGSAYDRQRGIRDIEPILHSVLTTHLEARSRALNLMVYGQGFAIEPAVELNRLRRRAERWTDLLLSRIANDHEIQDLAFEPHRATQFAEEMGYENQQGKGGLSWEIFLASLRVAFQNGVSMTVPNSELNKRVAQSVLDCLPSDLCDSTDLPRSLWLLRLNVATDEAQSMIDAYLSLDEAPEILMTKHRSIN